MKLSDETFLDIFNHYVPFPMRKAFVISRLLESLFKGFKKYLQLVIHKVKIKIAVIDYKSTKPLIHRF